MNVLFVCSGNAYRSPVAEALLRKLKPQFEVDSAGTDPAIPVSEAAKKYLAREDAQKYLKHAPESLDEKELNNYDLIIAMKPKHKDIILSKCPECEDKIVVWNIDDPYSMPKEKIDKIFIQIKDKINDLINSFLKD